MKTFDLSKDNSLLKRYSITAFLLIAVVIGLITPLDPFFVLGLFLALIISAWAVNSPHLFLLFILITGPMSFAFLTNNEKPFLTSLGGVNIDGLKLLGLVTVMIIYFLVRLNKVAKLSYEFRFYVLFLILSFVSIFYSIGRSIDGFRLLMKLFFPFAVLILVRMEVQDNVDIRKIRMAILVGGIIFSSIGIFNVLIGIGLVDYQGVIQYSGGIIHQNILSHYLLVLSLFTLISFLYFKKKVYLLLTGLFLIQLFFTFSRVTIAAAAIGFSVVFLLRLPKVKSMIVSAVILGFLIFLIFGPSPIHTRMFFDPEEMSLRAFLSNPSEILSRIDMKGRDKIWKYSIENVFLPSPLKGGGVGSTNYIIEKEFEIVGVMHNEYLRILVETGVIVFFIFLFAYLKFLKDMIAIFRKSPKKSQTSMFALLGFVSVVCYFTVALTSNVFDSYSQFSMYVFCFLGLAYRSYEIERVKPSEVISMENNEVKA